MAVDVFQAIADKAKAFTDHKVRFESLIERAEAARKGEQTISLPEFEAFGWGRFEEFLNRFEESLNSPLLERVRGTLENAGVTLNSQMIERLKDGLTVRREKLVEIAQQTAEGLKTIVIAEVQEKAKQDVGRYLEERKWDSLIERVNGWYQLEQQLASITKIKDKDTPLYNAVFDLVLQQGPQSKVIQTLKEVENTAHGLGGDVLKQQIKFEAPESPENPLATVESNLSKIAQKKEEIRQLQGEDIQIDKFMTKGATLKEVIESLEKERRTISESLDRETKRAREVLERRNNLAALLKEGSHSLPTGRDMKNVKMVISQLESDIQKLSTELEKSLTPNTRILIENLFNGRLPQGWGAKQVFPAIQELLSKGFSFEVKPRE
jgi:regulator of replication initiation timing